MWGTVQYHIVWRDEKNNAEQQKYLVFPLMGASVHVRVHVRILFYLWEPIPKHPNLPQVMQRDEGCQQPTTESGVKMYLESQGS